MIIDHVHFFVDHARNQGAWFARTMGWNLLSEVTLPDRELVILSSTDIYFLLSSPREPNSDVARHLQAHGPGVAEFGIQVNDLSETLQRWDQPGNQAGTESQGRSTVISQLAAVDQRSAIRSWAHLDGWGSVSHTLLERCSQAPSESAAVELAGQGKSESGTACIIDHIVLNVPAGELAAASAYYQQRLGLQPRQSFLIQSKRSGLKSQVLADPMQQWYFNINEPTSSNSQIQEFLDMNHGAGIQHIALRCASLIPAVKQWRHRGLPLLSVSKAYYQGLKQQIEACDSGTISLEELLQITEQHILLDWHPASSQSLLLQIFSRQILPGSHFFLEFIERRAGFNGFGERNFQALYEAIEDHSQP